MPKVFDKAPCLHDMRTTADIFWSPRWGEYGGGNSYVLLKPRPGGYGTSDLPRLNSEPVECVSINGIGEWRWTANARQVAYYRKALAEDPRVAERHWDSQEFDAAYRHFGLTLPEEMCE